MPSTLTPAESLRYSANASHTQGFGSIKGTNTIFFIPAVTAIPRGRKAKYLRVVSAMRPEKVNPYRVCWTVGGDKVEYPFDVSTKTADLTTTKILINSVVSTPNAKFLTVDLKDFYLGTPMARYKYMHVPIWMLPDAIIDQYNLHPLFHNGYVYVKVACTVSCRLDALPMISSSCFSNLTATNRVL